MARARNKNCGPTRGRQRILKLGMGSGKNRAKINKRKRRS